MMHGHEKSRSAIVAVKPTNKAERSAAEPVERRAETKGNADQQRTRRTQRRISVSKMLARIRRPTHPTRKRQCRTEAPPAFFTSRDFVPWRFSDAERRAAAYLAGLRGRR